MSPHAIPAAPKILALWSVPRSRSTAFFRMFLERGDFQVIHEPFSYLAEFGEAIVDGVALRSEADLLSGIRAATTKGSVFFKDTTDARYRTVLADQDFLGKDAVHTFLIRHPRLTIPSYFAVNPSVRCDQIGFGHLREIFTAVAEHTGRCPIVIDAEDLVRSPEAVVGAFCAAVGIAYLPESLHWRPGERPEWAPSARWHREVSHSAGFTAGSTAASSTVDEHPVLRSYLKHHLPCYEQLYACRLRI